MVMDDLFFCLFLAGYLGMLARVDVLEKYKCLCNNWKLGKFSH